MRVGSSSGILIGAASADFLAAELEWTTGVTRFT
jgi:hypothetical protein